MLNLKIKFYYFIFTLTLGFSFSQHILAGEKITTEKLPNDVRYMLEDMYGSNKHKWPDIIYHQDLNQDGMEDWVVQNKKCQLKDNCPADIFICIPGEKGKCSEYCYKEVNTIINLKEKLPALKCESTC